MSPSSSTSGPAHPAPACPCGTRTSTSSPGSEGREPVDSGPVNTHHHVAVRVALGSPRPVSSVPRVPAVGSLPSSLRRAWCMYVSALVCLCGYTRVPPTMPSAQIPGQGVVTAVPVGSRPSLCPFCVHLPHLRFEIRTSFWPSKSRASVLLSRLLHLTCNYVQNLCFCPFCVHLPHAFSFYNIYVIAVVLGLRQVYTKWALRRRPRCPPGVP